MSYREDFDEKEASLQEDVLGGILSEDDEDDDKVAELPEEEEKEWE